MSIRLLYKAWSPTIGETEADAEQHLADSAWDAAEEHILTRLDIPAKEGEVFRVVVSGDGRIEPFDVHAVRVLRWAATEADDTTTPPSVGDAKKEQGR